MCTAIFALLLLLLSPAASLEIVCGSYHNCVFERGQTTMKCWGKNGIEGRLGYDDTNSRGDEANEMGSNLSPVHIGVEFVVDEMTLGLHHSCAISDDRAMTCFGGNQYSQLGFDGETTTGDALPFLEFGVDFNISKIAAGYYHTCALSTDAALKCFGRNNHGQCGAGTTTTPISGSPSQINAVDLGTNFTPIDVHTFYSHVCILSQQGTLKCFGHNGYGQLGYGDTVYRGLTPESMGDGLPIVNLGSNFIVAAIAAGGYHSCALSTMKTVKCWGYNAWGQCGTPHSRETGDELPVLEFGADFIPMQLSLGDWHTCILSEAATLICFGNNKYGQLGIGSNTSVDTPSTLTGIDLGSDFVPRQVAAGGYHTCAVSTDDGIKCWGSNQYGQLGLGHLSNIGDEPNNMGDNLPFVDVAWPTVTPTTTSPATPSPTTASPTTSAPSSTPTVSPTTDPTTSDSTQSPTVATTTVMVSPNSTTVTVTIRTDSLSSTEILIAVTNAFNSSLVPLTFTMLSNSDGASGTVELLVAVPLNVKLDYDVIEATLREAMVDEYGDDIKVDIDVHGGDDDDITKQRHEVAIVTDWSWLVPVALCIASVCFCFAVAGVIKCIVAKRRPHDIDNHHQMQAAQIELAERPHLLPAAAVVMPNAYGSYSESEVEEKKEEPGVNPGAGGEPDLELEESVSNRDEGRRASMAAQTAAVTAGMAADEFELVDDDDSNQITAGHTPLFFSNLVL